MSREKEDKKWLSSLPDAFSTTEDKVAVSAAAAKGLFAMAAKKKTDDAANKSLTASVSVSSTDDDAAFFSSAFAEMTGTSFPSVLSNNNSGSTTTTSASTSTPTMPPPLAFIPSTPRNQHASMPQSPLESPSPNTPQQHVWQYPLTGVSPVTTSTSSSVTLSVNTNRHLPSTSLSSSRERPPLHTQNNQARQQQQQGATQQQSYDKQSFHQQMMDLGRQLKELPPKAELLKRLQRLDTDMSKVEARMKRAVGRTDLAQRSLELFEKKQESERKEILLKAESKRVEELKRLASEAERFKQQDNEIQKIHETMNEQTMQVETLESSQEAVKVEEIDKTNTRTITREEMGIDGVRLLLKVDTFSGWNAKSSAKTSDNIYTDVDDDATNTKKSIVYDSTIDKIYSENRLKREISISGLNGVEMPVEQIEHVKRVVDPQETFISTAGRVRSKDVGITPFIFQEHADLNAKVFDAAKRNSILEAAQAHVLHLPVLHWDDYESESEPEDTRQRHRDRRVKKRKHNTSNGATLGLDYEFRSWLQPLYTEPHEAKIYVENQRRFAVLRIKRRKEMLHLHRLTHTYLKMQRNNNKKRQERKLLKTLARSSNVDKGDIDSGDLDTGTSLNTPLNTLLNTSVSVESSSDSDDYQLSCELPWDQERPWDVTTNSFNSVPLVHVRGERRKAEDAQSEAELNEILAELQAEENVREHYMTCAAVVPDQLLNVKDRNISYDNRNGFVDDAKEYLQHKEKENPWTPEEIDIFQKRYCKSPKQFYKIAQALPNKSTNDCVKYYYHSKMTFNYKRLLRFRGQKKGDGTMESMRDIPMWEKPHAKKSGLGVTGLGATGLGAPRRGANPARALIGLQMDESIAAYMNDGGSRKLTRSQLADASRNSSTHDGISTAVTVAKKELSSGPFVGNNAKDNAMKNKDKMDANGNVNGNVSSEDDSEEDKEHNANVKAKSRTMANKLPASTSKKATKTKDTKDEGSKDNSETESD